MFTRYEKRRGGRKWGLIGTLGVIIFTWMIGQAGIAAETITVWHSGTDPDVAEVAREWVNECEKRFGIKMEFAIVQHWEQAIKMGSALAAGKLPDMISIPPNQAMLMISKGLVQPVDDILDEIGRDKFIEPFIDWHSYKGKSYGIPIRSESPFAMWYRRDLYEKYGLSIPFTWNQLAENVEKIGEAEDKMWGIEIPTAEFAHTSDVVWCFMLQNNARIFDENGNVVLNSPETIETLEFLKDLYERFSPITGGWRWAEVKMSFWRGKVAHCTYQNSIPCKMPVVAPEMWYKTDAFFIPPNKRKDVRYKAHTRSDAWMVTRDVSGEHRELVKKVIKLYYEDIDRYTREMLGNASDDYPVLKEVAKIGSDWWQHKIVRQWSNYIMATFYVMKDITPFALGYYKTPAAGKIYNTRLLAEVLARFIDGEPIEKILEEATDKIKGWL